MKKIIIYSFLLVSTMIYSQEVSKKINDIDVTYKLIKIESTKKSDKYSISATFKNNTGKDLYYKGIKNIDEFYGHFAKISIKNVKNIFTNAGLGLSGERTNLKLVSGEPIYILRNKKEYTAQADFKVDAGVVPVVTDSAINIVYQELTNFVD